MTYKTLTLGISEIYLRDDWFEYNGTYVKGSAFIDEKLYKGKELAKFIYSIPYEDIQSYRGINGFYCSIKSCNDSIQIISDCIRSYPLFYLTNSDNVYISDDPYILKDKFSINKYNELSKMELMLLRYVTGEETLYEEIKQLEAGQIINFDIGAKSTYKYYKFLGKHNITGSKTNLANLHEKVLINVFNRLIKYANGRTIVIPLSGGYDSRLVAVMLKRLKYDNVITFTYGLKDNPEQIISRMVAKDLGFKWIFIPYTNEKTFEWYNSDDYRKFENHADNLSSILMDRDYPAVYELKKQKLIPEDALIVPGHSGDFLSGRLMPYSLINKEANIDNLVRVIFETQYTQWDWKGKEIELGEKFKEKIIKIIDYNKEDEYESALDAYDVWEWQERQSKYIVNSIRIYEYLGYDWWLPLWDREITDFWTSISKKYLRHRSLYAYHVALLYSNTAGIPFNIALVREETLNQSYYARLKNKIRVTVIDSPLELPIRRLYKLVNKFMKLTKTRNNFDGENRENDWEVSSGRLSSDMYKLLLPYLNTRDSSKTLMRLGYIKAYDNHVAEDVIDLLKDMRGY